MLVFRKRYVLNKLLTDFIYIKTDFIYIQEGHLISKIKPAKKYPKDAQDRVDWRIGIRGERLLRASTEKRR